jgi:type I restriction enzyme S subunit
VCPESLAGWFVSPEYRTFRCVESESLPGYLAPLVRTEWFWSRLANATRGVGARRERTRPEQFLNVEIPMPDLPSQYIGTKVIAEIEALQRLQADTVIELDALLPSVLSKAFSGEL